MAIHFGKEGVIKVSTTTVVQARNYQLSIQAATTDQSVIGDTWDVNGMTTKAWDGSFGLWWDPADAGQAALTLGSTVTVNLYPMGQAASSTYYSGAAIVTGIGAQGDRSGNVENALTFKGTGTLSTLTV